VQWCSARVAPTGASCARCAPARTAGRRRTRPQEAAAVRLLVLVVGLGCTAAIESGGHARDVGGDAGSVGSRVFSWLRDLATGARRAATDWGVVMDIEAEWKSDIELCSRKKVLDAFFTHADEDDSGTLSRQEWTKACTDHRKAICDAWEKECNRQMADDCLSEWSKTCQEEPKKLAERMALEKAVFDEMGSRPVISERESNGLISGDGEITLAEFQQPVIPYISG